MMPLFKTAQGQEGNQDAELLERIEAEVKAMAELGLMSSDMDGITGLWRERTEQESKRFINSDFSLNVEALRNFWRRRIFVVDHPDGRVGRFSPMNVLDGNHRATLRLLRESLDVVVEHGYGNLIKKYPCPIVGNPRVFHRNGLRITLRWLRNIYFTGLMDRVLKGKIGDEFVLMDIGSSFGAFSSLVKWENPGSHHVLVDFSEHLIMAKYFLGKLFPEARIAGAKELSKFEQIDKNVIRQYDFCLIPCEMFSRLAPDSIDVVTSFGSLSEMPRKWFDFYLQSPAFQSVKFFLTISQFQAAPVYETDVTILDYPIWDARKRLHFTVSPMYFPRFVARRGRFFTRMGLPPHLFEYIGEI